MKHLTVCLALICLIFPASAQESKELDSDIVYDEAGIPFYELPALLVSAEGDKIATAKDWRTKRRPQILSLFSNLVYGRVPMPESPIETSYSVIKSDPAFMRGKATRKDVRIQFSNAKGSAEMTILVFTPNNAPKPAPAFMIHSFNDTKSADFDVHPDHPELLKNNWPLGAFFDRGYAFVAVYQKDLVGHNEVSFDKGIHPLFFKEGQSFPKADEWGVISAVAWGGMRALDYLETDDAVDHTRVALMGHSKMGKTALWTAAQDERFALVISAESGCAGAALWRRRSGETLKKMVTRFPYWLSRNAWKFVDQEDDLPVDQHMLIALMAPRPVYVASGSEDGWADPRGEYLSAYHASEVYQLLGKTGLTSEATPPLNEAIIQSEVGYHIKKGGHSVETYDWMRFMDFMDYHFGE
ncbi:MAG: acetylxylan esterase [Rhodothermales bacterium]